MTSGGVDLLVMAVVCGLFGGIGRVIPKLQPAEPRRPLSLWASAAKGRQDAMVRMSPWLLKVALGCLLVGVLLLAGGIATGG